MVYYQAPARLRKADGKRTFRHDVSGHKETLFNSGRSQIAGKLN
jgi:hypothetical protein